MKMLQIFIVFQDPEMFRKFAISGSFPGPQRVDLEMVFIFSVDSSRVDAISGLLCNLMAAWKPEIDYFFFRNGHKDRSKTDINAQM